MPEPKTKTSRSKKRLSQSVPIDSSNSGGENAHGAPLTSPAGARKQFDRLTWQLDASRKRHSNVAKEIEQLETYLAISDQVTEALDVLSQKLFEDVLGALETHLTIAIQEVLEQPIQFRANASFKRGAANVDFLIERDGNPEDVNRGVGGSVQNILSVGLRMFALATLDKNVHRRFLVLDEQDCWLRSELVPKLVNIVHRAAKELDFQVILISHHDVDLFDEYADKIYRLTPSSGGLLVDEMKQSPLEPDSYA